MCQQHQQLISKGRGHRTGRPCAAELLPGVLPDQQRPTHVHVERADDALLGDLHTDVQLLDQTDGDSLTFVPDGKWEK